MSSIDQKDLYPIIEIANQRLARDQDRLSEAQVDAIAVELGIPHDYVDEAQRILRERRQAEARHKQAREHFRKKRLWMIGVVAVMVALIAIRGQNALNAALAEVEGRKAQVINVMERQEETRGRLAGEARSRAKAAELAGAENRVRIERKRYDDAVTLYNKQAAAFPDSLWSALFGLPDQLALSKDAPFVKTGAASSGTGSSGSGSSGSGSSKGAPP